MKPRIAAICAIVAFATCGGRAPAQFPDCAHISIEAQGGECQAAQEVYVVNDRTDGQVTVTIHVVVLEDQLPGTTTSLNNVLTLAAGEREWLGCLLFNECLWNQQCYNCRFCLQFSAIPYNFS